MSGRCASEFADKRGISLRSVDSWIRTPKPRVKVPPSWTLFRASEFSSAWASVFTAQNSTP